MKFLFVFLNFFNFIDLSNIFTTPYCIYFLVVEVFISNSIISRNQLY